MSDPVLARRDRIRKLCELGSKVGYSCFGAAMLLFVVAFIADFPSWIVTVIIAAMVLGSVTLLPAIVFGYGVKAADAEDRGEKFGY
ncbi:MAG: hypothetical protein F2942_03110 [Actinobacteria bacterium]|uniref:Unannotated protein n=1 Tax=freshwater metagenome TaxID=449393 RepID=A0A6J7RXH7_9ZZZZ|nr:hypothetical protein [Actinomycetota bacterium]MSV48279.1 hypothetical protein [Actinomycetota bacterium]MSV84980.1 hypothetical protein [Actinomycetota bacterium]MSX75426.1 hypothetical protein [Actinomycetota bacterium]MSY23005.1 hypothetical protein [Actinomycetota bacterium]